ncbi:MAG: glycosyltransferase [Acetatifactor sp.]|nr:glycosyltransferase [Acetatifactor sp.]
MILSVIVPVYNTKAYLPRCLDSILKQQISDMEIICVDDGSTDGSGEILDQYAARDTRIQVIHKANAGLVAARKSGLEVARGTYTAYVDSDDWIEPEMYKTLCDVAKQYGADMVCSDIIHERGISVVFCNGFPEGLYIGKELDTLRDQTFFYESSKITGINPSLCIKLFLTSMLQKAQSAVPDEVDYLEDRLCTLACMLEAKSVYILKKAFYHYVFYDDSMSHQEDTYHLDKLGKAYRAFQSMYQHPNFSEKLRVQCEIYMIKMIHEGMNNRLGFSISDLMWINPRWTERFPAGSKIILYGAGKLGKVYYRRIASDPTGRLLLSGWVDRNYKNLTGYPQDINAPEYIRTADYDYVLVAVADRQPAQEICEQLINDYKVDAEKIVWLEPQAVFWEYAEAAGLLKG